MNPADWGDSRAEDVDAEEARPSNSCFFLPLTFSCLSVLNQVDARFCYLSGPLESVSGGEQANRNWQQVSNTPCPHLLVPWLLCAASLGARCYLLWRKKRGIVLCFTELSTPGTSVPIAYHVLLHTSFTGQDCYVETHLSTEVGQTNRGKTDALPSLLTETL